jgi:uncharacterized membrane protein YidH (DUF202 family)
MTDTPAPQGTTGTLPAPSANGSAPTPPAAAAPRRRVHTRIGAALIGGALLMAVAGTARITQLRQIMRRDRRKPPPS